MGSVKYESLDTNIILRLLWEDIPEQYERAIKLLERDDVVYLLSDAMLSEVVFVLTRMEVDRETIVGALMRIISRPNVRASDLMGFELFWMYLHHPKLSFTDCYLAIEATMNKAEPLWTFDKALAKENGTAKLA